MAAYKPNKTLNVTVTGAAGQIGYSFLPLLAKGLVFGTEQALNIKLLEIPPGLPALMGVVLELEDLACSSIKSITATSDAEEGFRDADVAVLIGSFPRKAGMERRDLLAKNIPIFSHQGRVLAKVASPDVRVVVVGNPANTNAMILSHVAPSIPARNISALTRLDHNRAIGLVAKKLDASPKDVSDVYIWGNHSSSQYPDFTNAKLKGAPIPTDDLGGTEIIASKIIPTIQKRGAAVIQARGASSAMSAAVAIGDHLHSWLVGDDSIVSMAVPASGHYDIKDGIWFSFPVRCPGGGQYEIVDGLEIDDFSKPYIQATKEELFAEREEAMSLIE